MTLRALVNRKGFVASILGCLLLLLLLYFEFYSVGSTHWSKRFTPTQHRRFINLVYIVSALSRYEQDNEGWFPERLSQLVPSYIAATNAGLFFASEKDYAEPQTSGYLALIDGIDRKGAFVYLGETGRGSDVIVYEDPDVTKRDSRDGKAMIMTGDHTILLISKSDLARRLERLKADSKRR